VGSKFLYQLLLLFCLPIAGFGQSPKEQTCEICAEGQHTNTSPYDISWKRELPFLFTGVSLFTTSLIIQANTQEDALTPTEIADLDA